MRPKKRDEKGTGDLFRARLDQIINMKHELVRLAEEIDWDWIDDQVADCFASEGRPGTETRFMIGILLLRQIYGLSDEGVWERWVHDPYFQHFTGETFFQHEIGHERSELSHWRGRLGEKLELLLAESLWVAHATGALKARDMERVTVDTGVEIKRAYVDKGYVGHGAPKPLCVYRSGQKRGVHGQIKKELRRRAAIEPVIGHLKSEGHPRATISKAATATRPTPSSPPPVTTSASSCDG